MGKGDSRLIGHFDIPADAEKNSTSSEDAISCRRINKRMLQSILLIWLDNTIDDTSPDCQNTITQLRRVVNTIKKYHEQWAKEWPKIKGVFTEITSICEALKKAARQCKQDSMPISVMATNDDMSKKNLDQLEPSFMYTQILKEVLLSIEFEEKHIKEFINYCRDAYAEDEWENVKKFEQTYHDETPICWYTYNCFLYSMLNRALWLMDVNMIIKLGFFIKSSPSSYRKTPSGTIW